MKSNPMQTLVELAQVHESNALKRLASRLAQCRSEEEKFLLLQGYRNDYCVRFSNARQAGMNVPAISNFMQFMNQLEAALGQQKRQVDLSQRQIEDERDAWQQSRRRLQGFESLLKRRQASDRLVEARRAQSGEDEFAARSRQSGCK